MSATTGNDLNGTTTGSQQELPNMLSTTAAAHVTRIETLPLPPLRTQL